MNRFGWLLILPLVLFPLCLSCDVQDSSTYTNEGGVPSDPVDPIDPGPDLDTSCGVHLGDTTVFDDVPGLRPEESQSFLGASPGDPFHIHLSWQSDPATSMTVTWRTEDQSKSTVLRVSTTPQGLDDPRHHVEISEDNRGEGVGSALVLPYSQFWNTVHVAEICGLSPATTYFYQVGGKDTDGTEILSDTYSFRTGPDPESDQQAAEVRFVVLGDTRDHYDRFGTILEQAASHDPDFIVHSGDFVDSGFIQSQWDAWFTAAEPVIREIPLMGAIGNHELNAENYFALFAFPGNEYWYAFRYGNVQAVALTDNEGIFAIGSNPKLTKKNTIKNQQRTFMDETFRDTDRLWKVLYHHRPIYSSSSKFAHGSNLDLQNAWLKTIDDRHVHMIFAGHDHHYERTCPIQDGARVPSINRGTLFTTSAGGGAGLYDSKPQWFTEYSERIHHFVLVTLSGKNGTTEAFDIQGDLIDRYPFTLD